MGSINGSSDSLRYIAQSYTHADSQASALRLILTLNPHWEGPENKIEFVRFTDGITNTVRRARTQPTTETALLNRGLTMAAPENHQSQAGLDRGTNRPRSSTDESVR